MARTWFRIGFFIGLMALVTATLSAHAAAPANVEPKKKSSAGGF